jgi:predicted Zn-dependent protease with MMP-like domain
MMAPDQRTAFDELLGQVIAELPEHLRALLEEVPVIVEDDPSPAILEEMDVDPANTDLCGLHWGVPLTRRSVEHSGVLPENIWLFRAPIMRVARYRQKQAGAGGGGADLRTQIRITLLHEIGHHFGLDERDLAKLGYA